MTNNQLDNVQEMARKLQQALKGYSGDRQVYYGARSDDSFAVLRESADSLCELVLRAKPIPKPKPTKVQEKEDEKNDIDTSKSK